MHRQAVMSSGGRGTDHVGVPVDNKWSAVEKSWKKKGTFFFLGGWGGSEMVSDELRIVTIVARRLPSLPFQPVNSGFF